jgi:hypothetical protein
MSNALNILAIAESIGAVSPVSDDEGVLRHAPQNAPTYNKNLRDRKPPVEVNEEFIEKYKEKAMAGKTIVDMVEQIGSQGLEGTVYNPDLDSRTAACNKARNALQEAIQVLSEGDVDYWCPDAETKMSAPKIRDILVRFSKRLQ